MAVEQARRITAATRTRKAHRLGIKKRRNATRVRQHLMLLNRTMSIHEIAKAASMEYTSIWKIMRGVRATVLPTTEQKILAVTPINGAVLMDSIGAQRRIQALATMGWTGETVGRLVAMRRGDTWANITRVMQGQQITASLAHEINAVYADLCEKTPPTDHHAKRVMELAQRSRWAPPAAWTVDIDDPNARPDWASVLCKFVACGRSVKPGWPRCEACLKRLEKHGTLDGYSPAKNGRALVEDALFISKNEGLSLRNEIEATLIAERLGVTLLALQQGLKRHSTVNMQAEELAEKGAQ
jgi:hypothetical protein